MQLANPHQHVGSNVRIRSHGSSQHFGRGRLLRVEGQFGIVQPFQRHRKEERVPLTDLHTWSAGNVNHPQQPQSSQKPQQPEKAEPVIQSATQVEQAIQDGPWIVADVDNVRFFVSTYRGFKPELNRARRYDVERAANHSASLLRLRRGSEVGRIEVLTVEQAQQIIQDRYQDRPVQLAPEPQAPEQAVSASLSLASFSKASPDNIRLAADILKRMADAEGMYREALADLEKIRAEWRQLEERITSQEPKL
ncbi:MAG: hypothetical protein LLG01_15735 [Planctomycetaceae bacterium]|nr:hypothetical protein [Planctomycetaceae bacterium]